LSRPNKKPAGAYRTSGPMSANFDALLKPPRARSYAVIVMMTVMSRGELHGEIKYTRPSDSRQVDSAKPSFGMLPGPPKGEDRYHDKIKANYNNRVTIVVISVVSNEIHYPNQRTENNEGPSRPIEKSFGSVVHAAPLTESKFES
jgi:hypothetical protein